MVNAHYELLYIIPLKYTDQENIDISKEIEEVIKKYKGTILKTAILGKRKLAYEIKHVHTGYYVSTHFKMEEGKGMIGLNKELQLKTNDNILRYQIVKTTISLDEEKYKVMFGKKQGEELVKEPKVEIERKKKREDKGVNKEEMDKKIDAIMDDDMKDLKK